METGVLSVGLREAARRLSVCEKTIHNLVRAKQLKSFRIGRRHVIRVADLESFVKRDHPTKAKATRQLEVA